MRKAAKAMKPKLELRNENGQWIQLFKLPIKTIESKYRDGQEFTEGLIFILLIRFLNF